MRANDHVFTLGKGSISGGSNAYQNGFVLNHDISGGPLLEMYNSNTQTVGINGNSGNIDITGTLTQSSDRRLKKDITPLTQSLQKLKKVRGVSYFWKNEEKGTTEQIGVIAQELEKEYPQLVSTDQNGMKSVNYSQMSAVLIEAVKELNSKIENLENENQILKAELTKSELQNHRLNDLQKQINTLQQLLEVPSLAADRKDGLNADQ